jgi:aryl-alcohol dehydrogenase-like predicted oxidoreductase
MAGKTNIIENSIEHARIAGTSLQVSRVTLGTWAIGGWMWGGTDEAESIATIRAAIDHGINLVDTAPVHHHSAANLLVGITPNRLSFAKIENCVVRRPTAAR